MRTYLRILWTALIMAIVVTAVPQAAMALGTIAGTSVDNTVTLDWNAGSVPATASTTTSFVVDQLVAVSSVNNGVASTVVWPSETNRVLAFDVENVGNSTIDMVISTSSGPATVTSNVRLFQETDGNGTWSGGDTPIAAMATTLTSAASDSISTFYIVTDVQAAAADGDSDDWFLVVTAYSGGAIMGTQNSAPFGTLTQENVMNDLANAAYGDTADDGIGAATGTFSAVTADLTVTKTFTVTDSSPFNTGQHAIPGATVSYTIHLLNSGSGAATAVSLTDTLDVVIDVTTDVFNISGPGTTSFAGGAGGTILWAPPDIAGGGSVDLTYDVVIP